MGGGGRGKGDHHLYGPQEYTALSVLPLLRPSPDSHHHPVVLDPFHVEADGGDGGHHLVQVKPVLLASIKIIANGIDCYFSRWPWHTSTKQAQKT